MSLMYLLLMVARCQKLEGFENDEAPKAETTEQADDKCDPLGISHID